MCGIAAVFGGAHAAREAEALVREILSRIAHRGEPRFQNELWQTPGFAAGANRLALTSGDECQPVSDPTGRYRVFLNGEIYSLHGTLTEHGQTMSDTKALADEIGMKGITGAFRDNHGMYASVIFDTLENRCFLARDPFGIKPLYFSVTRNGILVASEIKALSHLPFVERIEHVEPGEILSLTNGSAELFASIDVQGLDEYAHFEIDEYSLSLRRLLTASLIEQTKDGHEYGLYLSGGVDSSALYALSKEIGARIVPFVLGNDHSSDVEAARLLTRHFGEEVHIVPCPDEDELFEQIEHTIWVSESFEPNVVRQAGLSMAMARHVKDLGICAILCGEGSDELFGGYPEFWSGGGEFSAVRDRFLADLPRTQLQRVDRANMASTLEVRVPFLTPAVASLALSKSARQDFAKNLSGKAAKLPLRLAMQDLLPKEVAWRDKVVFSEGAGLGGNDPQSGMFAKQIDRSEHRRRASDDETSEWNLWSKEEELYFSIFKTFGFDKHLSSKKRVFANSSSTM